MRKVSRRSLDCLGTRCARQRNTNVNVKLRYRRSHTKKAKLWSFQTEKSSTNFVPFSFFFFLSFFSLSLSSYKRGVFRYCKPKKLLFFSPGTVVCLNNVQPLPLYIILLLRVLFSHQHNQYWTP